VWSRKINSGPLRLTSKEEVASYLLAVGGYLLDMVHAKSSFLAAIHIGLVLIIFLDRCNDNASEAGLQLLPRRGGARRRAGRKANSALFPQPVSRPKKTQSRKTQRRYRIDESEVDNRGRRLTVPLRIKNRKENRTKEILQNDAPGGRTDGRGNYGSDPQISPSKKRGRKRKVVVTNVHELRSAVLDDGVPLRDIELDMSQTPNGSEGNEIHMKGKQSDEIFSHEVLEIISKRAKTKSKPGKRAADDKAKLALSIEGGGMRGAVSAGMVGAIACLGLCDCFDEIYGSSAGSIVGAYMISRQMCIDVYTDVLTTANKEFLCKNRMISSLVRTFVGSVISSDFSEGEKSKSSRRSLPGLNISFILDGIMCPDYGIRPLDFESFKANDAKQPLRVVTSVVKDGKMDVVCLGSKEKDFFDDIDDNGMVTSFASTSADGTNHGLFACLEASMKVPAATGPPVSLIRNMDMAANKRSECFDAFCYEPIPYRSAVEEGATHVLVLRTRPEGSTLRTKPTIYESLLAPNYFKSHRLPQVADFFKSGGQQYIYLEDILALNEGKGVSSSEENKRGIRVPPPGILYGANPMYVAKERSRDRTTWKKAHLLPIAPRQGCKELSTLSQDKDDVLQAIRDGFTVAFDMLAPAAGLDLSKYSHLNGERVAELVFPRSNDPQSPEVRSEAKGHLIDDVDNITSEGVFVRQRSILQRGGVKARLSLRPKLRNNVSAKPESNRQCLDTRAEMPKGYLLWRVSREQKDCPKRDAKTLLTSLPGLQEGKLSELAKGLHSISGDDASLR